MERPVLNKQMDSETFLKFYYLKEELVSFCRENGLPTHGVKSDITVRIAHFLDTGEIVQSTPSKSRKTKRSGIIKEESCIEEYFVCSEAHRIFFKEKIGSQFTFNVAFQKWLKNNPGKTYTDAIEAYHRILAEKKHQKTRIDNRFEYNSYIRDFFADNQGKILKKTDG